MQDPTRLDSATALARTPLFSQLGRLDLARLAGELEEQHFTPGQVIVREGDPADGFYVIKAGRAAVVPGVLAPEGAPLAVLGPGEGFGEIALLTDSPRTASVVTQTEVTVWRLSRKRFEALLARERTVAQSIERALSLRLAATSHETATLGAVAQTLIRRAFTVASPGAGRLMAGILLRPTWPSAALARACERTGLGPALAELEALPRFLRRDGERVVVDRAFAAVLAGGDERPDPAWCEAAADELAAAGDPVGALDLELGASALARAVERLSQDEARLTAAATPADVERWLGRVTAADPGLTDRLLALRARVARDGSSATADAARPAGDTGRRRGRWRSGALLRLVGAAVGLAIFTLGWLLPPPAGLGRAGLAVLGAIVATVPLLVVDVLPDYVIMLLLSLVLVVPGLVPPATVLAGFATPAWIMILTLLAVGNAVSRSGLMFRLVLLSLQRLPPNFATQSLVLCGTGILMTAGLTSGSTRLALGIPIARGISDAMGFERQSPGSAAIGLLTFFSFLQVGELFLTGTFTGLVVHDLLPPAARHDITWWRWFFVALPVFVITFGLVYLTIAVLFEPHRHARVDLRAIRLQQALLGPLTRNELWSAAGLLALVVGFATRDVHGVAPAWLAMAVFLGLFMVGALDQSALQGGGSLGLLVYSGIILSLGGVFAALGIDAWLGAFVKSGMPGLVHNPYGFVGVVAVIAFLLHFFVPWMTASTLLALVTMPLATALGFHPFVPVLVALVAGDHTVFPYVNSGYSILYFASEGELFSHAQARWPLVLEALYRILALLASVPVWHLMGLL